MQILSSYEHEGYALILIPAFLCKNTGLISIDVCAEGASAEDLHPRAYL